MTPDGREAWLFSLLRDTIWVYDTATDGFLYSFPGTTYGFGTRDAVITPDGAKAYVPLWSPGNVSVIDTASHAVIKTIYTRDYEYGESAVSPDGRYVYVSGGPIFVIDTVTDTVVSQLDLGTQMIRGLAVSPDGSRLFVGTTVEGLFVIDTGLLLSDPVNSVVAGLPMNSVWGLSVSPDGEYLYVASLTGPLSILSLADLSVQDAVNVTAYDVVSAPECLY